METDKQSFKTVATFTEKVMADMCVAMLGDNGIPAGVFGADSSYPCLNYALPIEVKVNADDYEKAVALIPEEDRLQEE